MAGLNKSEFTTFHQGFLEAGSSTLQHLDAGGVKLRVEFTLAAEGDVTKINVTLLRKRTLGDIIFQRKKTSGDITLLKNTPLTDKSPCLHLPERAGPHGFNLIIEIDQLAKGTNAPKGLLARTLLVARSGNDNICHMPDLREYKGRVPVFARHHPECFPGV